MQNAPLAPLHDEPAPEDPGKLDLALFDLYSDKSFPFHTFWNLKRGLMLYFCGSWDELTDYSTFLFFFLLRFTCWKGFNLLTAFHRSITVAFFIATIFIFNCIILLCTKKLWKTRIPIVSIKALFTKFVAEKLWLGIGQSRPFDNVLMPVCTRNSVTLNSPIWMLYR